MSNAQYNMGKLEAIGNLDAKTGVQNCKSYQAFFDGLDWFVGTPKKYFEEYNPTVVIYDDDTRNAFLGEVSELKEKYEMLGLQTLVTALTDLEEAVGNNSVGSLSDWIVSFNAKADQLATTLSEIRVVVKSASEQSGSASAQESGASNQNREKPLILAVDDKPELLTVLVEMLKDEYTVMGAVSGVAALRIILKHNPQLFLLDIEMPDMDGYQVAKSIRKDPAFADTPIIFLTAKNSRDDVISAIKHGGNDYIVKPVEKEILLEKIRNHIV